MAKRRGAAQSEKPAVTDRRYSGNPTPWILIGLIAITIVVFAGVRNYPYINLDDPWFVANNAIVNQGVSVHTIWQALTDAPQGNWIPLTWMSYMVEIQLFGLDPGRQHLTNVGLHVISTLLLFLLLSRITARLWASAFVAALFAVHPLHVESVAWTAERKDVLSTMFLMLTLLAYAEYTRKPDLKRYLLVAVLFTLGLLSKSMLVTVPFLLVLLDCWPLARLSLATVREKIPLFVLTGILSVVTFIAQNAAGAISDVVEVPVFIRVENGLVSYLTYILHMFWPAGLALHYPFRNPMPRGLLIAAGLVFIGMSILAIRVVNRVPYVTVGWFWYVGMLVPVIGIIQVGRQSMADRYTYVPIVGLFIILTWGMSDLLAPFRNRNKVLALAALATVLLCMIAAQKQVSYWSESATLWQHSLDSTGDNPYARGLLAGALMLRADELARQSRFTDAIGQFSEALRLKPDLDEARSRLATTYNNFGSELGNEGNIAGAIAQINEALRLNPNYAEAHNNLAIRLAGLGKLDEAIQQMAEAIRLKPEWADLHLNQGSFLAGAGRIDLAIAEYSEALRLNPNYVKAHNNLGKAYRERGRIDDAMREFSEVLRINPNDPGAQQALNELSAGRSH